MKLNSGAQFFPYAAALCNEGSGDSTIIILEGFFMHYCSHGAAWVRITIKPRHCPPTKQCGGHWISAISEPRIEPGLAGFPWRFSCKPNLPLSARSSFLCACAILHNDPRPIVQAEAISGYQQLHMFAPAAVNLSQLVPMLCRSIFTTFYFFNGCSLWRLG